MNYYKRHLGDYARDTGHLTMLEHGAYGLLLDRYYATERGIAPADAYRICRARSAAERKAVDSVLAEFFTMVGAWWTHGKCDEVIEEHREQAETNRRIAVEREATKRARTVATSCNESLPEREPSHKPVAISHKPSEEGPRKRGAHALPDDFKITPGVDAWCAMHGYDQAQASLDYMRDWAKSGDKRKADWEATLRNCIKGDWGDARKKARERILSNPNAPRQRTLCRVGGCKNEGAPVWSGACAVHWELFKPTKSAAQRAAGLQMTTET